MSEVVKERHRAGQKLNVVDLAAIGLTLVISFLLQVDGRTRTAERISIYGALAASLIPLGLQLARRANQVTMARLLAVAGLLACSATSYRIGGLAYLLPATLFFLAFTMRGLPTKAANSARSVARALALLVTVPAWIDVGSFGVVARPLLLACFLWWSVTHSKQSIRFVFGFLAGTMFIAIGVPPPSWVWLAVLAASVATLIVLAGVAYIRRTNQLKSGSAGWSWPTSLSGVGGGIFFAGLIVHLLE